jgi:uncharacterized protein (TIGR02611 family)
MTEDRSSIANRFYDKYMSARRVARNNRALDATWRMIILVVGLSIVCIGIFFLLFPGPGWGAIILGLIVLATEFAWARRALHPVRIVTSRLATLAISDEYRYRRMVLTLVGTMIVVIMGYTYWARYGATMDGFGFVLDKLHP